MLVLSGCAAGERPTLTGEVAPTDTSLPSTTTAPPSTTVAGSPEGIVDGPEDLVGLPDAALVATAAVPRIEVFAGPIAPEPEHVLDNPTSIGGPLVFLVEQSVDGWHEVLLPLRPNGSTGWVRADDVTLSWHQYRVEVHLEEFRLDVFHEGEEIFEATVGVARENAPTPGGRYYITELLAPPDPNSVYGSFAYGLSGFSEVFESFNGGPGQLGIHGTNDPSTIGTQVSSGCVRLNNSDIEFLAEFLPLGTPVEIFT